MTEEHKKKISIAHLGRKKSLESRIRMSKTRKLLGLKPPSNLGKKFSEEHKRKIGQNNKGENNYAWKGGISFEPYSLDWTETLRRSIRERDKYTCKICSKQQSNRAHDIHHIDENKKNCNPINLITLCISCHRKTYFNKNKWIKYFQEEVWKK